MSKEKNKLKKGDTVETEYGKGVISSVEFVEVPSDEDNTFYVVKMADGRVRNFKVADFIK